MNYYLIDYENVNIEGLKGVNEISAEDKVILFYNENSKIPLKDLFRIKDLLNRIESKMIRRTANNYLDFYLSATAGKLTQLTPEASIVIISKDKGFTSVLDFCIDNNTKAFCFPDIKSFILYAKKEMQYNAQTEPDSTKLFLSDDIAVKAEKEDPISIPLTVTGTVSTEDKVETKSTLPESIRKEVRLALKKDNVPINRYTYIYKAFFASNKKAYLAQLTDNLGKDIALKYYQKTLPIFKDFCLTNGNK